MKIKIMEHRSYVIPALPQKNKCLRVNESRINILKMGVHTNCVLNSYMKQCAKKYLVLSLGCYWKNYVSPVPPIEN